MQIEHIKNLSSSILGENMIQNYIDWEKKQIDWWKEKLGISDHGVAWISFIKGILVGLLFYHFFII